MSAARHSRELPFTRTRIRTTVAVMRAMVPGETGPSVREDVDLRQHDRNVLEFLSQTPTGQVAFQGLRRRLGMHPEQLSRALHRLAGGGVVERTEHGDPVTAQALTGLSPDALTHAPGGAHVLG